MVFFFPMSLAIARISKVAVQMTLNVHGVCTVVPITASVLVILDRIFKTVAMTRHVTRIRDIVIRTLRVIAYVLRVSMVVANFLSGTMESNTVTAQPLVRIILGVPPNFMGLNIQIDLAGFCCLEVPTEKTKCTHGIIAVFDLIDNNFTVPQILEYRLMPFKNIWM